MKSRAAGPLGSGPGRHRRWFGRTAGAAVAAALAVIATPAAGQTGSANAPGLPGESTNLPRWTYADLADWSDGTPSVVRVRVRSAVPVEPARAPGLRPGQVRLYVEARIVALIAGPPQTGDSLRYLVDVPLDARGKVPKREKGDVIVFARTSPDRPGELQLVAPDAQIAWSAETEARLTGVLHELLAGGAPPRVSAVREAIHVPGTLAGEGETQLFLATADGEPASITVLHRPGAPVRWSVSFSEVLDARGEPPARDTLTWYRLACFLPPRLAPAAHVSATPADRARADADYRLVLADLGPCTRNRR